MTKVYNKDLLLNSSSVYLEFLKEVDITALYMCTLCEKAKNGCIYKFCKKSIHCTGYLLIQVEIVSVCKSHYMYWLVSQSSLLTFLLLECGHSWTISSVAAGAGAGTGAGTGPSAGASSAISAISASSTFSSFLSAKYRIRHRSIWCCHEDKVR